MPKARQTVRGFLAGLSILAILISSAPRVAAQQSPPRLVSVSGELQVRGRTARLDILVNVPPGADSSAAGQRALAAVGASPPRSRRPPAPDYSLTGQKWPQFFDRDPRNNYVLQFYNPAGDLSGGAAQAALLNAEATWSSVRTSSARFQFGGVTTRCPSLFAFFLPPDLCPVADPFDGFNDVGWLDLASAFPDPNILGLTFSIWNVNTGSFIEADVALDPRIFSAPPLPTGTPPPGPPPPPPPGGATAAAPTALFDVESVMVHENGHVLGLDHTADPASVMYPFLAPGEIRRTLSRLDSGAVSFLYPHRQIPEPSLARPQPFAGTFTAVARLGDPAPGAGNVYVNDFEPFELNDSGVAAYAADFTNPTVTGEGAFLAGSSGATLLAGTGLPAPGGGTFGAGVWQNVGVNSAGDAAFAFTLDMYPFSHLLGLNSGVYRYDARQARLGPVLVPFVTPAPGGGVFQGTYGYADLNGFGDVVFAGILPTTQGISGTLGMGVFRAARGGSIERVAAPGDPAPGGGIFDFADSPAINDRGDIAFGAHVRGEDCITLPSQSVRIFCGKSLYLKRSGGAIQSIVHQGDPAPGGGVFRYAFNPAINGKGDVAFIGDVTPAPDAGFDLGVFLYLGGKLTRVAGPGSPMPGGGGFVTASAIHGNLSLSEGGDVAFSAALDTYSWATGVQDMGVYIWSNGTLHLIVRTGSELPGIGEVISLTPPDRLGYPQPLSGAALNNRGQVLFTATVQQLGSWNGALIVATLPAPGWTP